MPDPTRYNSLAFDLSGRFRFTTTVGASPAGSSETIIGTLSAIPDMAVITGVMLYAWAAYTVGTSGTAVQLQLRRTNVAGTVIANSGAVTAAATNLREQSVQGFDTAPVIPGQVYVLTMTVTGGAAASTVSSLFICGIVI